jgi:Fe-S-cluster containining protein
MDVYRTRLAQIYQRFETAAAAYKQQAACGKGCAYCCTAAGSIDATTQEALVVEAHIAQLPKPQRKALAKALHKEMRQREQGQVVACPFLARNNTCRVYPVRPFSCRRIYSLEVCSPKAPPQLHRQVMAQAETTIAELRASDPNGYSGHLSYILHMLAQAPFRDTYLNGDFAPEAVMAFGKTHRISINRMNDRQALGRGFISDERHAPSTPPR